MSITDELRAWVRDNLTQSAALCITAIADRIDAEHERAMYDMRREHDEWVADRDAKWVTMPLDADGEPIHVGDVMEWCDSGDTLEVIGIGDDTLFYIDPEGDRTYAEWTSARNKRHYHAPTVEDVLREMHAELDEVTALYVGEVIDSDERDRDEARIFAEYAAKLKLTEGDA